MGKAVVSSKGQITIPLAFRNRMGLTPRREVDISQSPDGSVIIRPVGSVLHLAGSLRTATKPLSPTAERAASHAARAASHRPRERAR